MALARSGHLGGLGSGSRLDNCEIEKLKNDATSKSCQEQNGITFVLQPRGSGFDALEFGILFQKGLSGSVGSYVAKINLRKIIIRCNFKPPSDMAMQKDTNTNALSMSAKKNPSEFFLSLFFSKKMSGDACAKNVACASHIRGSGGRV